MTAKDHNKMLGILFLIYGAMQVFCLIVSISMFGVLGAVISSSASSGEDAVAGVIFLVIAVVVGAISIVLLIPTFAAGYSLLKNKPRARMFAIIAACLALLSVPFGTALGIYALWFLFGEKGKQFYASGGAAANAFNLPPPPPSDWR